MTYKHENRVPANAWIVVADRARARIFSTTWPESRQLAEVAALVHPESQMHERDVISDGPGTFAERAGGHHAGEPQTDFRHRTALEFAGTLAARLEQGRMANEYGRLVIVAPSLYLGVLREKLSAPLARMVVKEIDKDYTLMKPAEVLEQLHRAAVLTRLA